MMNSDDIKFVREWLESKVPIILVLFGPQASGKSVLAEAIITSRTDTVCLKVANLQEEINRWWHGNRLILEINDLNDVPVLRPLVILPMHKISSVDWLRHRDAVAKVKRDLA